MVAKFNGKGPDKKAGSSKPAGAPVNASAKKIESPASKAKAQGGSANAGSGIGNTP